MAHNVYECMLIYDSNSFARDPAGVGNKITKMVGNCGGEILVSRGELGRAKAVLEDARETLRASGLAAPAVFVDTQLARLELEDGRLEEACEALRATIEEATLFFRLL